MYCKKTRNDCKQCVISSAGVCPGSRNSGTEMSCNDLTVCVIVNERAERKQRRKRQIEGRLNWKRIINKENSKKSKFTTVYNLQSPLCTDGCRVLRKGVAASLKLDKCFCFYRWQRLVLSCDLNQQQDITQTHTHTQPYTYSEICLELVSILITATQEENLS